MYLFLHLIYSFLLFSILPCTQVLIQIHKYKDSDTAEKTVLLFYALLLFSNVGLALCCTEIRLYQPQTSQVICFDWRKNSTALFQNKKTSKLKKSLQTNNTANTFQQVVIKTKGDFVKLWLKLSLFCSYHHFCSTNNPTK